MISLLLSPMVFSCHSKASAISANALAASFRLASLIRTTFLGVYLLSFPLAVGLYLHGAKDSSYAFFHWYRGNGSSRGRAECFWIWTDGRMGQMGTLKGNRQKNYGKSSVFK